MKTEDFSPLRQLVRPKKCPKTHLSASLIAFRWECFSPSMIRRVGGVAFLPSKNWVTPWIYSQQEWDTNRNGDWHGLTPPGCAGRAPTWSILLTWLCLAQSYYLHQSNPHSSWGTWIILAASYNWTARHTTGPILDMFSGTADPGFRFTMVYPHRFLRTWKLTMICKYSAIKSCNLR